MIAPPAKSSRAKFSPDFGQRSILTVDTEEEFDWSGSFSRDEHGLTHVRKLAEFQIFCEEIGVIPVYLIDWPIATSRVAIDILSGPVAEGKAEIGIQLHPWVNPPFDEDITPHNSYAGNLPPELEEAKLLRLRDEIQKNYNTSPKIYRAGRYGLGPATAGILKRAGVPIDTSVRANFDYSKGGGPNYSQHPTYPYWVDEEKKLLELPLTTVFWGMLRQQGKALFPALSKLPHGGGLSAKMGLLEKIALTPEGVSAQEALRGIDIAIDDGLPLLVLSFHSPSLMPGNTPYVHDDADLKVFYDWLRQIYAYLDKRGIRPTSVAEIMKSVEI